MPSAIELFAEARQEMNKLDIYIPDKVEISSMVQTCQAMIAMSLNNGDVQGAVDVTDKMDVVSKWFQKLVNKGAMQQSTANRLIKGKFDGYRMMGEWLNDNIAPAGMSRSNCTRAQLEFSHWDDLPLTHHQGNMYQKVARLPDDKYESWFEIYLDDEAEDVDQLFFNPLWRFAYPKPPKEPEPELEVDLSPAGTKLYKALLAVRKQSVEYIGYLLNETVDNEELFFIIGAIEENHKGLRDTEKRLETIAGVTDVT